MLEGSGTGFQSTACVVPSVENAKPKMFPNESMPFAVESERPAGRNVSKSMTEDDVPLHTRACVCPVTSNTP
jgi:hypothetical protein